MTQGLFVSLDVWLRECSLEKDNRQQLARSNGNGSLGVPNGYDLQHCTCQMIHGTEAAKPKADPTICFPEQKEERGAYPGPMVQRMLSAGLAGGIQDVVRM
jgi:hypothetical protein